MSQQDNIDRDNLANCVQLTIERHFGSICLSIDNFVSKGEIPAKVGDILKKFVRTHGHTAVSKIIGHLSCNNISHKDSDTGE